MMANVSSGIRGLWSSQPNKAYRSTIIKQYICDPSMYQFFMISVINSEVLRACSHRYYAQAQFPMDFSVNVGGKDSISTEYITQISQNIKTTNIDH